MNNKDTTWVLPDELINLPIFPVTSSESNFSKRHANAFSCFLTKKYPYGNDIENIFVKENFSDSSFELVSFNQLQGDDQFCTKCKTNLVLLKNDSFRVQPQSASQEIVRYVRNAPKSKIELNIEEFLKIFNNVENFLNSEVLAAEFSDDFPSVRALEVLRDVLYLSEFMGLETLMESKLKVLKSKLRSKFNYTDAFEVEKFHSLLAKNFVKERFYEARLATLRDDPLQDTVKESMLALEKSILENKSYVIFSTKGLMLDKFLSDEKFDDDFLLRIYLNPIFEPGLFSILPYVEYNHLKRYVGWQHYSKTTTVFVDAIPSIEVMEIFKSLFVWDNRAPFKTIEEIDPLNTYSGAFEIAKNV